MNTCKNCKYYRVGVFESRGFVESNDINKGLCVHPNMRSNYTDGWVGKVHDQTPDNGVFAECDMDRAVLNVGPNFGCIHFEEKDK